MAGADDFDIPETGAVYTFGRSLFAENVPSNFFIRNDPIIDLACGDEHTAVVCRKGRVFIFGNNDFGQLGLGQRNVITKPSCVKCLKPEKAIHVTCGRAHTLVSTESGKLFSWGSNGDGQLGVGDLQDRVVPTQVLDYEGNDIRQLAAGSLHSLALSGSGHVYVWGSNSDGQLGLKDVQDNVLIPRLLPFSHPIVHISCGYYHTAIVTVEGDLYTFGEGENGKLGLPNSVTNCTVPTQVILGTPVRSVTCGGNHTLALTADGKVFAFGSNYNGQLGLGTDVPLSILPTVVTSLIGLFIEKVVCGENHSAFLTDQGQLYVCGEGRYGKLCNEDIDCVKQSLPSRVNKFKSYVVDKVACGGCHTMVLARVRMDYEETDSSYELQTTETLDNIVGLPPLQNVSAVSQNNNMNDTEDEDKISTRVEHSCVHSKEDLMSSDTDLNGNDEFKETVVHEVEDKSVLQGDFSEGTEHLDDTDEGKQDTLILDDMVEEDKTDVEDDEKDNEDVKVETPEKKVSRMSQFLSAFRRKKTCSAQSTRTSCEDGGVTPVEQQRPASTPDACQEKGCGSGDAQTTNIRSQRTVSGKSKFSETGTHKKSKTCTLL